MLRSKRKDNSKQLANLKIKRGQVVFKENSSGVKF